MNAESAFFFIAVNALASLFRGLLSTSTKQTKQRPRTAVQLCPRNESESQSLLSFLRQQTVFYRLLLQKTVVASMTQDWGRFSLLFASAAAAQKKPSGLWTEFGSGAGKFFNGNRLLKRNGEEELFDVCTRKRFALNSRRMIGLWGEEKQMASFSFLRIRCISWVAFEAPPKSWTSEDKLRFIVKTFFDFGSRSASAKSAFKGVENKHKAYYTYS